MTLPSICVDIPSSKNYIFVISFSVAFSPGGNHCAVSAEMHIMWCVGLAWQNSECKNFVVNCC